MQEPALAVPGTNMTIGFGALQITNVIAAIAKAGEPTLTHVTGKLHVLCTHVNRGLPHQPVPGSGAGQFDPILEL